MSSARSPRLVQAVPSRSVTPRVGGSPAGDRGIRRKRKLRSHARGAQDQVFPSHRPRAGRRGREYATAVRAARPPIRRRRERRADESDDGRGHGHGRKHARQRGSPGRLCAQPHPQEPPFGSITHDARRVEGERTKRSRVATSPRCGRQGAGRGSAQPRPGSARGSPA